MVADSVLHSSVDTMSSEMAAKMQISDSALKLNLKTILSKSCQDAVPSRPSNDPVVGESYHSS